MANQRQPSYLPLPVHEFHISQSPRTHNNHFPMMQLTSNTDPSSQSSMQQMSPNSRFSCNICGRSYQTMSGLRLHSQTHSGNTHNCHLCDHKFMYKCSLKKHLSKRHAVAQCQTCSGYFPLSDYNQHLLQCSWDSDFLYNILFSQCVDEKDSSFYKLFIAWLNIVNIHLILLWEQWE